MKGLRNLTNSITEIKGVNIDCGIFEGGKSIDLFNYENEDKNKNYPPHRVSVIFGRNGSGKSTLANFISGLTNDNSDVKCFYDKNNKPLLLDSGSQIRVFGEDYIRDKLYIEGDKVESIVMLGNQAAAKMRINEIKEEQDELTESLTKYNIKKDELENGENSITKLENKAKLKAKEGGWVTRRKSIEGGDSTPSLTSLRWADILKATSDESRESLEKQFNNLIDEYNRTNNVEKEIECNNLRKVELSQYDEDRLRNLLSEELDEPKLNEREKRLLELTRMNQAIIEKAQEVFSGDETKYCPMCQQEVTSNYKASITKSIQKILSDKADEFKKRLSQAILEPVSKQPELPAQLSRDVIDNYNESIQNVNRAIENCNNLIQERKGNLYSTVDFGELNLTQTIFALNESIDRINEDVEKLNNSIKRREKTKNDLTVLNDKLAYIDAKDLICKLQESKAKLTDTIDKLNKIGKKQEALEKEREKQQAAINNTDIAADLINKFLSTVYLDTNRFRLVPHSKVYKIESYGKSVKPWEISTGERNILALCYFFAESGRGKFQGAEDSDPQYLIIDDPISSFDMENRVGICSLLRERISHVLNSNDESRITLLTHDGAVLYELDHILDDIKELEDGKGKFKYDFLELSGASTSLYMMKKPQYTHLLRRAYNYASSKDEDEFESYVIGNILRRILEGYSTFNYAMPMYGLTHDSDINKNFGDYKEALSALMYRLTLNDDSHMEEKVKSLNQSMGFERYSCEEKKKLAQFVIVILSLIDEVHVIKQLSKTQVKEREIRENLKKWKASLPA